MDNPNLYIRGNQTQRNVSESVLQKYRMHFNWKNDGTDSLIDIGCGTGDATVQLLATMLPDNFKKLIGVDISQKMIDFACNNFETDRVRFAQMDIEGNVGISEKFGHAVSLFCFMWVRDQKKAFDNVYNFLEPNGDFLFITVIRAYWQDFMVKMSKDPKYSKYIGNSEKYFPYKNFSAGSEDYCKNCLKAAGFELIESEIIPIEFKSPHFKDILDGLKGINPMQSDLPEELLEEFYEDYRLESINDNFISEKESKVTYSVLVCYAKKRN